MKDEPRTTFLFIFTNKKRKKGNKVGLCYAIKFQFHCFCCSESIAVHYFHMKNLIFRLRDYCQCISCLFSSTYAFCMQFIIYFHLRIDIIEMFESDIAPSCDARILSNVFFHHAYFYFTCMHQIHKIFIEIISCFHELFCYGDFFFLFTFLDHKPFESVNQKLCMAATTQPLKLLVCSHLLVKIIYVWHLKFIYSHFHALIRIKKE